MSCHQELAEAVHMTVYFCNPGLQLRPLVACSSDLKGGSARPCSSEPAMTVEASGPGARGPAPAAVMPDLRHEMVS
jgi:hypothetical protein